MAGLDDESDVEIGSCPECFATFEPYLSRCPRCGHLLDDDGGLSKLEIGILAAMIICISVVANACIFFLLRITDVIHRHG